LLTFELANVIFNLVILKCATEKAFSRQGKQKQNRPRLVGAKTMLMK